MKLTLQRLFGTTGGNVATDPIVDRNIERIEAASAEWQQLVRTFTDATSGNTVVYLPDGNTTPKDFYWQKVDATANTVTITAFSPQTIAGAATYVLAAQYNKAYLIWNGATQQWYLQ